MSTAGPGPSRTAAARTPHVAPDAGLLALNLLAAAALAVLDAFTPPGIVVGILLVVPILSAATGDRPRDVILVFAASAIGYGIAAVVGAHTPPPPGAWLHNRILVVVALVAAAYLGILLQQRRLRALKRENGLPDAQEVNRLLMSLIVHDLRSPLTTALHTLDYLEQRISDASEDEMIGEARARLRRNLRIVDAFLAVAHTDREGMPQAQRSRKLTARQLEDVLHEEIGEFRAEATGRNKRLLLYHEAPQTATFTLDLLVLRHALTILIDNAVRYALPGPIRVTSRVAANDLYIAVEDSGPGSSGGAPHGSGAGLGLQLCAALLRRAGGELSRVKDQPDGSSFELRLPLLPNGASAPQQQNAARDGGPDGFRPEATTGRS